MYNFQTIVNACYRNKTLNLSIRLVVITALVASTTHYTSNINKEQLSLKNMKQLKHLIVIQ